MDSSPPGSSVHGILQARILEWVAISFSRGSSQPRDHTLAFRMAGGFFITEPPGKPPLSWFCHSSYTYPFIHRSEINTHIYFSSLFSTRNICPTGLGKGRRSILWLHQEENAFQHMFSIGALINLSLPCVSSCQAFNHPHINRTDMQQNDSSLKTEFKYRLIW